MFIDRHPFKITLMILCFLTELGYVQAQNQAQPPVISPAKTKAKKAVNPEKNNKSKGIDTQINPTQLARPEAEASEHTISLTPIYKTLRLQPSYRGEEEEGVHYFYGKDQLFYRVSFKNGLLYDQQGKLINPNYPIPTAVDQIKISSPPPAPTSAKRFGYAIYVMDEKGQFYLSFESSKQEFHHSSFLAGQPVACAGEMVIYQGKLLLINNQSGHYRPPPAALDQALDALQRLYHIDISTIQINRYGLAF